MWIIQPIAIWIWLAVILASFVLGVIGLSGVATARPFSTYTGFFAGLGVGSSLVLKASAYTFIIPLVCNLVRIFLDYQRSIH